MSIDFCTAFDLLQDMVFFGAGYYCLAHRKSFARQSIEQQNRLFGFHFNERDRKIAEVIIVIGGLGFITSSVISILRHLHLVMG